LKLSFRNSKGLQKDGRKVEEGNEKDGNASLWLLGKVLMKEKGSKKDGNSTINEVLRSFFCDLKTNEVYIDQMRRYRELKKEEHKKRVDLRRVK
jgi:hypothetical protein